MASMTIRNNSGLNAEPRCMPTFTSKPLLTSKRKMEEKQL